MATAVNHQDNFATNLTSNQTAGVTTTPLNSIPSVAAPFYIAFDATNTNSKYEVVLVTSKTATNINHAATTYAHTTAEEVRMVVPAAEFDTLGTSPQGYMFNGKISVTDVAGITVSIKTLAGTDPSVTDPVWVRIGDTMRAITSALSVAKADGTNWFNAGSSELATKEIDYFVYLGYNATDGVVIGFSRVPYARRYADFSATTTANDYAAISTISNAASTDYYENIGRFAATLSAGAGYTWSVPTYTADNLVQRPCFETRQLDYTPTFGGFSSSPTISFAVYKFVMRSMYISFEPSANGTSNATTLTVTAPFPIRRAHLLKPFASGADNGSTVNGVLRCDTVAGSQTLTFYKDMTGTVWTSSGAKSIRIDGMLEI
jgi:hypothetical protein